MSVEFCKGVYFELQLWDVLSRGFCMLALHENHAIQLLIFISPTYLGRRVTISLASECLCMNLIVVTDLMVTVNFQHCFKRRLPGASPGLKSEVNKVSPPTPTPPNPFLPSLPFFSSPGWRGIASLKFFKLRVLVREF